MPLDKIYWVDKYDLSERRTDIQAEPVVDLADYKTLQAENEALRELCGEAYQIVGSLASDCGIFGQPTTTKALDKLSAAVQGNAIPDTQLLPFPSTVCVQ